MLFGRKSWRRNDPSPEPAGTVEQPPEAPGPASGRGPNGERPQSFIDASLTIVGDLHADGDVRLDGRICGNVRCAQLVVGRDAAITGTVTAEQAIVRGRITGTIRSPVVILQDTAQVESEITYSLLAIDDGATFEGTVHRSGNPLEEGALASLAELQRMMLAAESSTNEGGNSAASSRAANDATAAVAPQAALPAPAANGHNPTERKPSASHT